MSETNKLGFPVIECRRCGGRGFMGEYDYVDAGRCFECKGSGRQLTAPARKAFAAYQAALESAAKRPAGDFKVGDRVRVRSSFGTIVALTTKEFPAFTTRDGEWPASTSVTFHFANSKCNFTAKSDMLLTSDDSVDVTEFTKGL